MVSSRLAATLGVLILALSPAPRAAPAFEEVSATAGIDHAGPSWGVAWGDFNDDLLPDAWVSNHGKRATLWLNQGDGSFVEIAGSVLSEEILQPVEGHDAHGAAWADYDNDGDQDLVQIAGGGGRDDANHLYVNDGVSVFSEQAASLGIALPTGRAHTPLWMDWDRDGRSDLIITSTGNGGVDQMEVYTNEVSAFARATANLGMVTEGTVNFAFASGLMTDGPRLTAVGPSRASWRVYGLEVGLLVDDTVALGLDAISGVVDTLAADLDGDFSGEIFAVRGETDSDVVLVGTSKLEAHLTAIGGEIGFSFAGDSPLTINLYPEFQVDLDTVHIGASGIQPDASSFTLDDALPEHQGVPAHTPGAETAYYIGYDTGAQRWQVLFSSPGSQKRNIVVTSPGDIDGLTTIGFDADEMPPRNFLFDKTLMHYEEAADATGLANGDSGVSVAAGDLDNDMDLDLYIVATGPVENIANIVYENQGGNFVALPDAGGAAGSNLGRGDSVALADYDSDGFLDLFLTNGKSKEPFHDDGPQQLFRNLGNANHWLEVDLEGVASNRDGIGATLRLTAGGVTQLREQSGGMHFRSQNHQRVHFGLGPNTRVDELVVEWPGGTVQTLVDLPADQILRVLEPVAPPLAGRPKFVPGFHEGVFLWKDFFDGPYEVRVSGDGSAAPVYRLRLLAGEALASFQPFVLPRGNGTRIYPHGFDTRITTFSREYGLSFTLAGADRALFALERDGVPNPRQLQLGAGNAPLTPAGWIADTSALPDRPDFTAGVSLGLFAGMAGGGKRLEAHWSGDGAVHAGGVSLLASAPFGLVTPLNLEAGDSLEQQPARVAFSGQVSTGFKGLEALFGAAAQVGIGFEQDGLFAYRHANPQGETLGTPNAYWLPRAEPYLAPDYDRLTERGLFLWQTSGGQWRLRATAGTGAGTYAGELISDQPFTEITGFNLEGDDVLDTSQATRIGFEFHLNASFQDGVNLRIADGASLRLDLTEAVDGVDPVTTIAIGEKRWPVKNLPLELTGW